MGRKIYGFVGGNVFVTAFAAGIVTGYLLNFNSETESQKSRNKAGENQYNSLPVFHGQQRTNEDRYKQYDPRQYADDPLQF